MLSRRTFFATTLGALLAPWLKVPMSQEEAEILAVIRLKDELKVVIAKANAKLRRCEAEMKDAKKTLRGLREAD